MRTRKSNRTKSYTIEKYDFEGSSDEEEVARRARKVDDRDENFEGAAAAEESVDEEELVLEQEALESEGFVSDPDGIPDRFARQRVKPIRPFNVRAAGITGYLDLEPVAADGRIVRAYCGPYDRGVRGYALVETWYGRLQGGVSTSKDLLDRWSDWSVLPPKVRKDGQQRRDKGVWSPNFFEREADNADHWYERVQDSLPRAESQARLSEDEARLYQMPRSPMPVLMGPYSSQQEVRFEPGDGYSLSQSGLPYEQDTSETKTPSGWMFDVGGIVTSMDWAPQQMAGAPQVLAMCVIPHSDQEHYDYEQTLSNPEFQQHGVVQLWEFVGERVDGGYMRPSTKPPKLRKTLCLDRGRARSVRWSPACGFLAVACEDGNVYVIEAGDETDGAHEKIQSPIASFGFPNEEGVKATALTWVNFNRLVVGYTDGSIALWSVRPSRLLSRHPVHHNHVVNLVSGYPAMPYLIASTPIGGTVRLLDLRAPSYETTEVQALAVSTQPNLIGYSDHLLGFFSMYPSAGVLNTQIGFMHHAHWPVARRIFTGESFPSCLSVGRSHPFLLVGSMDGSLWALNPQLELFTTKREPTDRLRVFQHEHRPADIFPKNSPMPPRGVSRIVQGFVPERNRNPKADFKPPAKKAKKAKKKSDGGEAGEEEEDGGGPADPTRAVVYEPLTRVTAVEWNPNEAYGCWAAAAMASGLIRVLDLGLEVDNDTT